jgi:hypothetical protein
MSGMSKAHERIEKFQAGELSGYDYGTRQALGRALTVDSRLRAIES